MTARRVIVWAISILFGLVASVGTIMAFGTTLEKFTLGNAILVFASSGSIVFIWLDYIFKTDYLRS
jgi:hypothetical protein